ncbi:unnamed protein product [Polarella glacialis]|uniref:Uncharacterized protein n=1 Tax=Polarella glacialis TaxID=89957 RepID=A0A813JKM6_POLGL|nr:unnamed protein product [Polarella glacialis]
MPFFITGQTVHEACTAETTAVSLPCFGFKPFGVMKRCGCHAGFTAMTILDPAHSGEFPWHGGSRKATMPQVVSQGVMGLAFQSGLGQALQATAAMSCSTLQQQHSVLCSVRAIVNNPGLTSGLTWSTP